MHLEILKTKGIVCNIKKKFLSAKIIKSIT